MADPIEELLKQIQQGETARSSPSANSSASSLPFNPSSDLPLPTNPAKPKPIDHLLTEIEDKPAVKPVPSVEPSQAGNHAPSEVVKPSRSLRTATPSGSPHSRSNSQSIDALLSQLDGTVKNSPSPQPPILPIAPTQPAASKPNFPVKPAPLPPPPQNPQQNPKIEKQKRQQAIERQAQEWLKTLDPHGGDAQFFETLAEKYSSRLEAAIDFLGLERE